MHIAKLGFDEESKMESALFVTRKSKLFLSFIVILFVLACALPGSKAQPVNSPSFTDHILVSLTEPLDGEAYPISAGLSIRGEAISDGSIARMELWADGELYEEYIAPEDGLGLLVHYWTWSPATLGWHTLMIRAYNDQDHSAFSSVVNIKGIPDTGYILIVQTEESDTVSSIAERYTVSVDDILKENPNLSIDSILSVGEEVFVHIGAPAVSSVPSTGAKALMKIKEFSANKGMIPPSAPSAPALSVIGQGCNATLSISDYAVNEQGFNIYRLNPGAMGFSKLTILPAHESADGLSYTDSNLYGLYHYYVAAFDGNGEAASNLVSLDIVDSNCAGTPTTIDDLALIPMSVEDYYLYISINNGNWRRFPADDFTYLKKSQGLDFGAVATSLAPNLVGDISMRGEVWGLVNGRAEMLGSFDKSIKANQAPVKFEAASFQNLFATKLEVRGVYDPSNDKYPWLIEKGFGYGTETFRFGTDTNASYGIWQVSSVPFDKDVSFNPACLLLSGKANGFGKPDSPFVFGIDFSALKPTIESVQLSPFENSFDQTPVFISPFAPQKYDASPQQTVKAPKWGAGAFGIGGGAPEFASFDPCAQNMSAEGVVTYYVRIIPMNNGQAAGGASNSVTLKYDPNGQIKVIITTPQMPMGVYYDIEILNFTGVHVPDVKYEYCVEIVENNNLMYPYKPGDKVCPEKDSGGSGNFLSDLSDLIEGAFNYISDLYNKLSDWVTDLVEKLNPLCIQAKIASSAVKVGEKEVKDACHYIAVIAVTAAKTYVGLPPSLPNFDQLTEIGKDNLVEMAAQELEAQGVPCPEECKNVIRKGIDYSIEQAKQSMSNSSCSSELKEHGYKPLCLPPGVTSKPDPRGQPAPAVAEVKVTRRLDSTGENFPEPKSCRATIGAYAKNNVLVSYTSQAGFTWNGGTIEGNLLSGSAAFPNLQPEESTTFPIVLDPSSFWLDGHKQFVKNGWEPEHYDDWYILYRGAMATVNAGGYCDFELPEGKGFSNASISKDQMQVGPLGDAWMNTCHPYNCP